MLKILALIGGLSGAATLSQYPAFTQQYLQRLAGQVDALSEVVRDFDTSALNAGLGREDALQQMDGTPFLMARQADMRRTFARHARLADNLFVLRSATPLQRVFLPQRMADSATLQATWSDFEPALPFSVAGVTTAGMGFLGGWVGVLACLALLTAPFRRKDKAPPKTGYLRPDPPLVRPVMSQNPQPRLMGERR